MAIDVQSEQFKTRELMVLPYGFILDWFMDDVVEKEIESENVSEAQAKLLRTTSDAVVKRMVAYMREKNFVFATETD